MAVDQLPARLRPERPWREHGQLYVDLFGDPAVAATLWPGTLGGPRTRAQALAMLTGDIDHWQRDSFGPWLFFELATGAFVGRGGLRRTDIAGERCVEILYAVRSDAWGRGYASEIARVTVAYARQIELAEIVGLVATANAPSRRVLEKTGIRFDKVLEHAGLPHRLGRLTLRTPPTRTRRRSAEAITLRRSPGAIR